MFWTDGANDRDWQEECHDEHRGQFQKRVPCVSCRAALWVDARTSSIFTKDYCDDCKASRQADSLSLPTRRRA